MNNGTQFFCPANVTRTKLRRKDRSSILNSTIEAHGFILIIWMKEFLSCMNCLKQIFRYSTNNFDQIPSVHKKLFVAIDDLLRSMFVFNSSRRISTCKKKVLTKESWEEKISMSIREIFSFKVNRTDSVEWMFTWMRNKLQQAFFEILLPLRFSFVSMSTRSNLFIASTHFRCQTDSKIK